MSLPKSPPELKRWFASTPWSSGLLTASSLALAAVWYARFYQAEPAPVVATTKHPVPLCPTLVLPSSGRRFPPPAETLLPGRCSYEHMCQSQTALLDFGSSPRSKSLCRLLPVPAAHGIFPTFMLRIFLQMPEPLPRRSAECSCLVLLQRHRPSPEIKWVGFFPLLPANTIFRRFISRLQLFHHVQASEFARLPNRSYRCDLTSQSSRGFYIRAEHASFPPHASDMLTTRSQAIDGVGTYTARDSQGRRLLQCNRDITTAMLTLLPDLRPAKVSCRALTTKHLVGI
jgi:hypothetical protein